MASSALFAARARAVGASLLRGGVAACLALVLAASWGVSATHAQPYDPSVVAPDGTVETSVFDDLGLYDPGFYERDVTQPFGGMPGALDVSGTPVSDLLILLENGAGLSISDGDVQPLVDESPAPASRVTWLPGALRITDADGHVLLEVTLNTDPGTGATRIGWLWSPYAYSAVHLPELGLTVRGLSKGEARRLGRPQGSAVVVTAVDDGPPDAPSEVHPGDVVTGVTGTPSASPLRLLEEGRRAPALLDVVRFDGTTAIRILQTAMEAL